MRWTPLVERWHSEFSELDPAWVLAIIAQESQGDPYALGPEGENSIGLMQIIARSWTGTHEQLKNPAFNLYVGMRMLSAILENNGGNLRLSLAQYNCGEIGVATDRCGRHGGYVYADRVLNYWVPVFRLRLMAEAKKKDRIGEWLADFGYRTGSGRWANSLIDSPLFCIRISPHGSLCAY